MTNYEKYQKEIIEGMRTDHYCDLCKIMLATKNESCPESDWEECTETWYTFLDWLTEEYKEPEVDWSKVEVDTPVLVSHDGETWHNRYFAKYEDGQVFFWKNGATSWSKGVTFDNPKMVTFPYAKLADKLR